MRRERLPARFHMLAAACALLVGTLVFVLPSKESGGATTAARAGTSIALALPEPTATRPEPAPQSTRPDPARPPWRTTEVAAGDSLAAIFDRLGLRIQDMYAILASGDEGRRLSTVHPGDIIKVRSGDDGAVLELSCQRDPVHAIHAVRRGDAYVVESKSRAIETRPAYGAGEIKTSLYEAALAAGLSERVIMNLAAIFGWTIDFALDIRAGDTFALVFEERYLAGGDKLEDGEILAVEFVNNGRRHRAVRYVGAGGQSSYYTPDGLSMKRAFLRSPVDFRRISSHFQPNRWHPVLGVKRPHRGVDYAAASGTPIRASGDGRVAFIGRKGGYGNTIILDHGRGYTTLYAHMSRFRGGLRSGRRVRQGETIGYVGMSGLATGPHLHYEFRVNGRHKNPVTVNLPAAKPIAAAHLEDFKAQTAPLIAQLDVYRRTLVALNSAD